MIPHRDDLGVQHPRHDVVVVMRDVLEQDDVAAHLRHDHDQAEDGERTDDLLLPTCPKLQQEDNFLSSEIMFLLNSYILAIEVNNSNF